MKKDEQVILTSSEKRPRSRLLSEKSRLLWTKNFVQAAVLLTSFPVLSPIGSNTLSFGTGLVILMIPVWSRALRQYGGAWAVFFLLIMAIGNSYILILASGGLATFNNDRIASLHALVLVQALYFGFFLWAKSILGIKRLVVLFGTGSLLNVFLTTDLLVETWWKTELSWTLSVLLLGLCVRGKRGTTIFCFLLVAIISVIGGARGLMGIALVSAVLFWYINRQRRRQKASVVITVASAVLLLPGVLVEFFTWLILQGFLGASVQMRTEQQIALSGSLISGGRQEWAAAFPLFLHNPVGYGAGAVPDLDSIAIGKAGLASVGANPESQYINTYMFGEFFRLHSLISDFWINFGLSGLLLAVVIGILLVRSLARWMINAEACGIEVFLLVWSSWDLLFSPMDTNFRHLVFALALILYPRLVMVRADRQ